MSWIITGTEKLPSDPDAATYIANVEAADGQELEYDVRMAINTFVKGCKADGIWNAIKASCILAGARTLNGALVPLAGTAPTNYNFVSADYNRKTGLIGDGSTKYLDSNRANNADPQYNNHNSVLVNTVDNSGAVNCYMDSGSTAEGSNSLGRSSTAANLFFRNRGPSSAITGTGLGASTGLVGISRNNASSFVLRASSSNSTISHTSQTPTSGNLILFARDSTTALTSARIAFYSIGESLDLALLDARVTTLIAQFAAAIP